MEALLRRWNALPREVRAGAIACALGALLLVTLAAFFGRDTRVPLFASPLRSEQVGEVVNRLAEWNVGFIVAPDNVRVDADRRNGLLLRLALAGVPHAHLDSSTEALSKAGPLTPQSVLDAQAVDGLAGDLAGGLRTLAGVEDAQVIIAPARADGFAGDTPAGASASVRLTLAPGAAPAPSLLGGIRAFVAAGVPGLDPKRVAILDDRGLALGADSPAADDAAGLQQSLQSALDQALGAGVTIVRVRISYDQRLRVAHEITRSPIGSRAIGTRTVDERYTSAAKRYAKTDSSVDRGSIVDEERIDTPAGRIERITVAVAVDARRRLDLGKIRSLAVATLGLMPARGDALSVEEIAFAHDTSLPPRLGFAAALGLIGAFAPSVLFVCVAIAVARAGAKPLGAAVESAVSRLAVHRTAREVAAFAPAQVRGALKDEPPHTAAAIISALPAATAAAVLDLYPAEERAAIVQRMSRPAAPIVPGYETIARRG